MGWKQAISAFSGLLLGGCAVQPHQGVQEPVNLGQPAQRLKGERHLHYRVGLHIEASPSVVWSLLTDAEKYPQWNRSVLSIEGHIAVDERIKLRSSAAPKRSFKLKVKELLPEQKMVWGSGGRAFGGERVFTLTPSASGGTNFVMYEGLGGSMMNMIEKKLPDLRESFDIFAADLKKAAESKS